MIRVVVVGAGGRMGREALRALSLEHGFEVVAAIVREPNGLTTRDVAGESVNEIALESELPDALDRTKPDAVLDLSLAANSLAVATSAISRGIPVISGVTGIPDSVLDDLRELADKHDVPILIAPNFAIGAVLMMRFAEQAARWMPDAEIIERHHEGKVDAPSGTAMTTAKRIAEARTASPTVPETRTIKAEGARGGDVFGVPVHSVRLPGSLAHQEILFGAPGETLTIRHDAADRSVYMPGVRLCLREVGKLKGLTIGMDALL